MPNKPPLLSIFFVIFRSTRPLSPPVVSNLISSFAVLPSLQPRDTISLEYLQLVPRRLTRMEFPFDRSEKIRSKIFFQRNGNREGGKRVNLASNLQQRSAPRRCREKNSSPTVASKRLLAIVQSTSATLIGFINTIKRGRITTTKPRNRTRSCTHSEESLRWMILVFSIRYRSRYRGEKISSRIFTIGPECWLPIHKWIYDGYYVDRYGIFARNVGRRDDASLFARHAVYLFCYRRRHSVRRRVISGW